MGSTRKLDVLVLLADLHKQATVERAHYYVGKVVSLAIDEIGTLRAALKNLEARPTVRAKRPVQPPQHEFCFWHNDDGWWRTDCGKYFALNDGSPHQNGMRFCYHCGRKLRAVQ
jgi:hypothetical protein